MSCTNYTLHFIYYTDVSLKPRTKRAKKPLPTVQVVTLSPVLIYCFLCSDNGKIYLVDVTHLKPCDKWQVHGAQLLVVFMCTYLFMATISICVMNFTRDIINTVLKLMNLRQPISQLISMFKLCFAFIIRITTLSEKRGIFTSSTYLYVSQK